MHELRLFGLLEDPAIVASYAGGFSIGGLTSFWGPAASAAFENKGQDDIR
jgi:hypothetical protein